MGARQDPFIGLVLDGRYEVIEPIGAGGMGAVYRARQRSTAQKITVERDVAIKFLRGAHDDAALVGRFQVEAQVISRLEHPSSLTYFDSGQTPDGTPYLVTELLQGESLGRRLDRGPIGAEETLRIIDQVLAALEEAHALGIVHRDLKPDNLFLTKMGVKVLDFGIAKILEGDAPHTRTGALIGTPRYLSPEQARGDPIDPRSDLYSLGVVAYHCLAGRPPFDGNSMRVLMDHMEQAPPPLATDREVERLVMQLLEKQREKRPESAKTVRGQIAAIGAGRRRTRPNFLPIGFALAAIAIAAGVWSAVEREEGPPPKPPAPVPPEGMVAIPGGTYRLGSTKEEIDRAYEWCRTMAGDECRREIYERESERSVILPAFFIDEREVAGADRLPKTRVTFADAEADCRSKGRSLPSEDQWEAAARGVDRRPFPWGDELPDCERTAIAGGAGMKCEGKGPREAGTSPQDRTPEGTYDLGGNVAEWTSDLFDPGRRVIKGGYFDMWQESARAAGRTRWPENESAHNIGFRCAAPAPEEK